jgi:hypothetical protein
MTTTYSQVLAQARREALRYVTLPTSEAEALQGYLNESLRAAWRSAPWPGVLVLEELPVASRLVSRRIGTATEVADVLGCYDGNPRETDFWADVEFEEDGDNLVLLDDVSSVWVDYLRPAPDLTGLSGSALDNFAVNVRFRSYMALSAAARLVRGDGTLGITAELKREAEEALAVEQGGFVWPARLQRMRMRK